MSTVSRVFAQNTTDLRARALNSTLIPTVTVLFFGGPGLPRILGALGLPTQPVFFLLWEFWFPTPVPSYLLRAGSVLALFSVIVGFVKFWWSDRLIEQLQLEAGVRGLQPGDAQSLVAWTVLVVGAAVLLGYPVGVVPVLQGAVMVGLPIAFTLIPGRVIRALDFPTTTSRTFVKTQVFLVTLAAAVVVTHVALFVIRAVGYSF